MGNRGLYLRVGLLIVGGLALVVALIWFLGGARIRSGVRFESYFRESVQGLEVGAPVKYRGVTLGRVTEIGLVSAEYGRGQPIDIERQTYRLVFVRFVIDPTRIGRVPDSETAVKTGLRARLASQGITGLTYLELDFVDPKTYPAQSVPWTPKDEYLPSMPSTLSQVQDAAQQVLAKLNKVDIEALSAQLSGVLSDLRTELKTGDVHTALVQAATLLSTLNDETKSADLPGLSADLKRTSTSVRETLSGEQVKRILDNVAQATDRLSNVAAKLPALIAAIQQTAQRANNGTADIEQSLVPLLRDMQATARNLRETTDSLRASPSQVLLGQPPPRSSGAAR